MRVFSLAWSWWIVSAPFVLAQAPAPVPPPVRGQRLIEITRAAADEAVSCMPVYAHGTAPARNGALFVLVSRATYAGPGRTGDATSAIELWRSDDRGASWRRATVVPGRGASECAIAPDGADMVCAWTAANGGKWSNVFAQRYDVAKNEWLGAPQQLTQASGDEDQYFATDVARAANGAIVVAIGSHRSPPMPPWTCGWSAGMRCLLPGKTEWTPVQQVNADSYGVAGNMLVRGDCIDFTFRSCPAEAVHALRTFDCARGKLLDPTPPITPPDPAADACIANVGLWCADGTGGRSLIHLRGAHEAGRGRLAVAHARAGSSEFHTVDLADDPTLQAGNENPTHYTLARGPGNQVLAYFSKVGEQFANLWQGLLEDGVLVGAPRIVVNGQPGQFALLNGMRLGEAFTGLHVIVAARSEKEPGGVIQAFGTWPAPTVWTDARR